MTHGSLFSGIGGFDLAAQWVGWENIFQVEIDDYCQKVLAKNFPNVRRYDDIKQFNGEKYKGAIDVISGGFPCQPFSQAGKRQGTADDRYLWPEMLRVIREAQPAFVVGENVAGLLSMEDGKTLERILDDLEDSGYQTEIFSIPAASVGAWHKRERIWVIANSNSKRLNENGIQKRSNSKVSAKRMGDNFINLPCEYIPSPNDIRGNDGLSTKLDESRVKALGNAIVPQVAYEIFKAIEEIG